MKIAIKKYVAWTFSGFIISLLAITSITLQASPPTYELNGNDKVKEHYGQISASGWLPLDMEKKPGSHIGNYGRSLLEGLVYKATYDKRWDYDTIHYQLQSLADDRISIIYQGDNNTTIGWSSPVFMIQIPGKNIELMPMSIKKVLKALYKLNTDDITEKMLLEKGVGTIKIRVCGMGRGKNYVLSESVRGPFIIAPHGIRWIEHKDLPRPEDDGFFVDKYDIKNANSSYGWECLTPMASNPPKRVDLRKMQ